MSGTIRTAVRDDAAALAGLATQLGYPTDAARMLARLERVRAEGAGEIFVALGDDARVVGWAHVVPRAVIEEDAFVELAGLVVDESARSTGVGAALLHACEEWARAAGFGRFKVRSNVIRERAHRFYLREGYAERKRQVVFEKKLWTRSTRSRVAFRS